jgi:hypothetical protein
VKKNSVIWIMAGFLMNPCVAEEIGRTNLKMPEGSWSLLTEFDGNLIFDQYKKMPLRTKVFKLVDSNGSVSALLSITSTEGGRGSRIRWISQKCPDARPQYYTNDFGSNKQPDTRDCLVVNGAFAPFKFYKEESEVITALKQQNIQLFTSGYSLRTQYGSQGGTYLNVNLMTTKKFLGLPIVRSEAEDVHEVPEALVSWGEALHKAVKDSVFSLGGELNLPQIQFAK